MNKRRRFQAIGWTTLAFLPLLLACLVIYGILWAEERSQDLMSVLDHGGHTTGTVISQEYFPSVHDEPDSYLVKYTFTLPSSGQEVIGYYTFYNAIPSGCNVGDQIEIAYDPKNPTINLPVIAEENEGDIQGGLWFGAILFSLIMCVITFFLGCKAWREWR